jgi:UDP-N-acetylglucosamine transferase subunit ALG13
VTTLFVSTLGGPLTELVQLSSRLGDVDTSRRLWVTHDAPQSRSLLAGEDVVFVPYIKEGDLAGVLRAFPRARRLVRERAVRTAVSAGSAIAVAYLGAARSLGREAYFIESAAFVDGLSKTARILKRIPGVHVYGQSPLLERRGFPYCGSVLDGFVASPSPPLTAGVRRVVVTVGTSEEYGFRRLVERVAAIVPGGVEVLWQTGGTDVTGLGITATPFVPAADLATAMAAADVVIAHAGSGSAIDALRAGRRPVLVPRRSRHGEVGNDHQVQVAALLAGRGLAAVHEADELTWDHVLAASRWSVLPVESLPEIHLTAAA